jgi:hypothetical protein
MAQPASVRLASSELLRPTGPTGAAGDTEPAPVGYPTRCPTARLGTQPGGTDHSTGTARPGTNGRYRLPGGDDLRVRKSPVPQPLPVRQRGRGADTGQGAAVMPHRRKISSVYAGDDPAAARTGLRPRIGSTSCRRPSSTSSTPGRRSQQEGTRITCAVWNSSATTPVASRSVIDSSRRLIPSLRSRS